MGKAHEVILDRFRKEGLMVNGDPVPGEQLQLIPSDVRYTTTLPTRTDKVDEKVPPKLRNIYYSGPKKPWERLNHKQVREHLEKAQKAPESLIYCVGCGRTLEPPFMQLDHVTPRSDGGSNDITNRILLCTPCNSKKSNTLTLSGLLRENKKTKWMSDEKTAKAVKTKVDEYVNRLKDENE